MDICCWGKRPPRNDADNMYVRLKFFYLPFFGDLVITRDFKQENTSDKISHEEFTYMVKAISSDCKHFSELKFTYIFMVLYLAIVHFIFPKFLFSNKPDESYPNTNIIVPVALLLGGYTIFTLKIIKISQNICIKIQKVLRTENYSKYISRGLCWELDPSRRYLHLNLNYRSSSDQYLIGEVMSNQSGMEEYIPYFDLENGQFRNIDPGSQQIICLKIVFMWIVVFGSLVALIEIVCSKWWFK